MEMSFNLLLHPKNMATSFKRESPLKESFIFLFLLTIILAFYISGLSKFADPKLYLTSLITLIGFAISLFSVFIFLIHLNARIFGGKIRFLKVFLSLFFLLCSLFLFFRVPLLLIFSLFEVNHTLTSFNMYINIFFFSIFFIYSLIIMENIYEMEIWKLFMSYTLLFMYFILFLATYKLSYNWIKSMI